MGLPSIQASRCRKSASITCWRSRRAPGSSSKLAHEIVENYQAFALKDTSDWTTAFGVVHGSAIETEDLVEKELGQSRRPPQRQLCRLHRSAREEAELQPRHRRSKQSFSLVVDQSLEGTQPPNARRVGRLAGSELQDRRLFRRLCLPAEDSRCKDREPGQRHVKDNLIKPAYVEGFASTESTPGEQHAQVAERRGHGGGDRPSWVTRSTRTGEGSSL